MEYGWLKAYGLWKTINFFSPLRWFFLPSTHTQPEGYPVVDEGEEEDSTGIHHISTTEEEERGQRKSRQRTTVASTTSVCLCSSHLGFNVEPAVRCLSVLRIVQVKDPQKPLGIPSKKIRVQGSESQGDLLQLI